MGIYVSDTQLAQRYGTHRTTIWRWVRRGILPAPVAISTGCTRWKLADIERRDAERERGATT